MTKIEEIKKAMTNPPPERLAKIEYQSHFLQILGIIIVCAVLIYKGLWYIMFALIFGVGVSYTQGITAYQKYKAILSITGLEYNLDEDKSPTRKRDYIIKSVFGIVPIWLSIIISLTITYFIIGVSVWYQKLAFAFFVIFFHLIIYFFLFYWMALPFHNRRKNVK